MRDNIDKTKLQQEFDSLDTDHSGTLEFDEVKLLIFDRVNMKQTYI